MDPSRGNPSSTVEGPTLPGRDMEKGMSGTALDPLENAPMGGSGDGDGHVSVSALRRASTSSTTGQAGLGAGFAHVDGEIGGTGYNDTMVDVIAVPCPGADPVHTWTSDPLPEDYFGSPSYSDLRRLPTVSKLAGDAILSPAIDRPLPKAGHMWVRQGIRRSASTARILLYRHRPLAEGITLEQLARDLLDQAQQQRQGTVS